MSDRFKDMERLVVDYLPWDVFAEFLKKLEDFDSKAKQEILREIGRY